MDNNKLNFSLNAVDSELKSYAKKYKNDMMWLYLFGSVSHFHF